MNYQHKSIEKIAQMNSNLIKGINQDLDEVNDKLSERISELRVKD